MSQAMKFNLFQIIFINDFIENFSRGIWTNITSSFSSKYSICIFPFSSKSIILIFCKKEFDKYFKFFEKLKFHNNEEQLSIINYLCFAYFEDIFLNHTQCNNIDNNQTLKEVSMTLPTVLTIHNGNVSKKMILKEQIQQLKATFSIDKHIKIPNLLSENFQVR